MATSAVILAAGRGTRLRPITDSTPKAMVEVGGSPLLSRIVSELLACQVRTIVFVVGHLGKRISDYYGTGAEYGASFFYVRQQELNGTGGALRLAREHVSDKFLVIFGDSFFGIGSVQTILASDWQQAIGVIKVSDPRRFGIVEVDPDRRITNVVEKPERPKSNLAIAGLYKLESTCWKYIDNLVPSVRKELEIPDAIQAMLRDQHAIGAVELRTMIDVGTLDDLAYARELAAKGV